jgi:hypothetical protein
MDFHQTTQCYISEGSTVYVPEESILRNLLGIVPARHFSVIQKKPPHCVPGEIQMQIKEWYVIGQALKG